MFCLFCWHYFLLRDADWLARGHRRSGSYGTMFVPPSNNLLGPSWSPGSGAGEIQAATWCLFEKLTKINPFFFCWREKSVSVGSVYFIMLALFVVCAPELHGQLIAWMWSFTVLLLVL